MLNTTIHYDIHGCCGSHFFHYPLVGCILGELLNKAYEHPTGRYSQARGQDGCLIYAMFPASSHVDHLEKMMTTLGSIPQRVIQRITDSNIITYLQDKVRNYITAQGILYKHLSFIFIFLLFR